MDNREARRSGRGVVTTPERWVELVRACQVAGDGDVIPVPREVLAALLDELVDLAELPPPRRSRSRLAGLGR